MRERQKIFFRGWHPSPIKGSFMIFSILGFFVSAYIVFPKSFNFGVSFMVVFTVMFLASLVSMTKAPLKVK